jgi:transitional endoplasmic reticulum ATPase
MLAKAIANESEANFISVKGPELFSKWLGESERAIKKLFLKARQTSPCIVFFDEIDAIATRRGNSDDNGAASRVVNQLLTELDGMTATKGVVFVAATNRLGVIDPALIRPGRIDKIIYIPLPDNSQRLDILKTITKNIKISEDINLESWAEKTEGLSGADLTSLIRDAGLIALERSDMNANEINDDDVVDAYTKYLKEQEIKKEEEVNNGYNYIH